MSLLDEEESQPESERYLSFVPGRLFLFVGATDGRMLSTPNLQLAIADFLAYPGYRPCFLLVHPEIRRLIDTLDELSSTHSWPHLSVGQELPAVLLSEPPQRRPRTARRWMVSRLGQMAPGPVSCTEIDLLFEPTLELDPLSLLSDVSRATRLVVAWPGSYADDVLAYAVPDHSHYRTWRKPQVPIVVLE